MSGFNPSLKKFRTIGIFMILMMLCIGSVAAERVGNAKETAQPNHMMVIQQAPPCTSISTSDLTVVTVNDVVAKLLGSGVTVSGVSYSGANGAAGTFSGGSGIIGFNDGIMLSSGDISNAIGPNEFDAITHDNLLGGDADLNLQIPGYTTYDAAVLEFDFVPQTSVITFDYVFTSDEYNEWANSPYNDVFGFYVNGQNVALIPGTSTPVAINNVNMGNPGTGLVNQVNNDPTPHNAIYYRNNDLQDGGGSICTEMDGLTTVFTATAQVTPGQKNHIKLAIADAGDHFYDSNVFIKAGSFSAQPLTLEPLTATNTVGSTHTVTAT